MKQIFTFLITLSFFQILSAQAPQTLNYQGVARGNAGQPYANTNIAVRLKIHDVTANGNVLYSETRSLTTNAFGLFNITINSAGALSKTGDFSTINWNNGAKFLETEIDPAGGSNFVSIGTTQMQSVAYSLLAAKAAKLVLPYSETASYGAPLLHLTNQQSGPAIIASNEANGEGIYSESKSGYGIKGYTYSTSSQFAGVYGLSNAGGSSGILGVSNNSTGVGVVAVNNTTNGVALQVDGGVKISGGNTSPGTGKVLTSDANGNATWKSLPAQNKVGFRAKGIAQGGLQNIPEYQWYKVHFGAEEYDAGSDYTLYNQGSPSHPSSSFTAPVTGFYSFSVVTQINSFLQDYKVREAFIRLQYQRGSTIGTLLLNDEKYFSSGVSTQVGLSMNLSVHLLAGDHVWAEVLVMTDNGKNPKFWDGQTTHSFSGFLVFAD